MNKDDRSEMKLMLTRGDRFFIGQDISLECIFNGRNKTQIVLRLPREMNVEFDLVKHRARDA